MEEGTESLYIHSQWIDLNSSRIVQSDPSLGGGIRRAAAS